MLKANKIYLGDCLEVMEDIDDKSIDMILCDLPYGTTACKWDTVIPFEPLWALYKRIIKDNGAIVLTASQPFTSALVMSNIKMFKYEWIWKKNNAPNYPHAKNMPLKVIEEILVFSKNMVGHISQLKEKRMNYFPQGTEKCNYSRNGNRGKANEDLYIRPSHNKTQVITERNFPENILKFGYDYREQYHPTQKPVALFEYLIKTYTNEGDLVLDNCIGSGTTAIACMNLNRRFIGIEKDLKIYKIAKKRISEYASSKI
jgi:site-specific DNA-methyltransferase (adenine-specific)